MDGVLARPNRFRITRALYTGLNVVLSYDEVNKRVPNKRYKIYPFFPFEKQNYIHAKYVSLKSAFFCTTTYLLTYPSRHLFFVASRYAEHTFLSLSLFPSPMKKILIPWKDLLTDESV